MNQKLMNTLTSGEVTRYHATPSVDSQTISQHSWGVTLIFNDLCRLIGYGVDDNDFLRALTHDCIELFTGDLPFTIKRDHPDFKTHLATIEGSYSSQLIDMKSYGSGNRVDQFTTLLKLADYVEGMWWCAAHENPRGGMLVLENYAKGVAHNWENAKANCYFSANEERHIEQFLSEALMKFYGRDPIETGGPTTAYVNQ
jgi:5'-deoxynucleotidase YfbR-like HD superfamily hydrolase